MRENHELARLTIDLPKHTRTRLKRYAALQGKSMREVVNDLIDQLPLEESIECKRSHKPNKETLKAIKDAQEGKGLVRVNDIQDFLDKLKS